MMLNSGKMGGLHVGAFIITLMVTFMTFTSAFTPPPPIELQYNLEEEVSIGTFVANILQDGGFAENLTPDVVSQLQFQFLSPPNANLEIGKTTGLMKTSGEIDRDTICPQAMECTVKVDIAVSPVQYFQIVKVTIAIVDKKR